MTTPTTVLVQLKVRSDTAANWTSANPTLLANELGRETDTGKIKIGTGSTAWTALPYQPFGALITNADISATAEIAVSKLADGAARQLLQTDAAGTGVEWTNNVDIPGTLDVTGTATFDGAVTVAGDLTVNGTTTTIDTQTLLVEDKNIEMGVVATPTDVTADGGGITLRGTTNKTINWVDATDAWTSSERFSVPLGSGGAPSLTFTGDPNTGIYSPGADQVAISTGGSGRLFVDASGNVGVGTNDTANAFVTLTNQDVSLRLNPVTGSASITAVQTGVAFRDLTIGSNQTIFQTAATERLRITSAGLVGVGTSSPNTKLSVIGTTGAFADASIRINGTAGTQSNNSGLWITGNQTTSHHNWLIGSQYNVNNAFEITPSTAIDGATFSTPAVVVTSAGRLGIGTTPTDTLTVNGGIDIPANYTINLGSDQGGGATLNYNPNGNLDIAPRSGFSTVFLSTFGGSERARIDSSGRLLVGTSSSRSTAIGDPRFQVEGTTYGESSVQMICNSAADAFTCAHLAFGRSKTTAIGGTGQVVDGDRLGAISWNGAQNSTLSSIAGLIECYVDGEVQTGGDTTDMPGRLVFSTTADGASSPTERIRISQNGNTIITANNSSYSIGSGNNTIAGVGINPGGGYNWFAVTDSTYIQRCNNTDGNVLTFLRGGTTVGSVSITSTATAYNTSSDYRLKENIIQVTDGITRLQQLKPSRFNFITDPAKTVDGFIAHEVQTVVPEAITGEKDAVDDDGNPIYQGIDQSKLVPLLTAALQEAIGEIESLKARVAALESAQ